MLTLHQHDTGQHDSPCAVCGRDLGPNYHYEIHDVNGNIDMGWFPIGPECAVTARAAGHDVVTVHQNADGTPHR